MSKEKQNLIDDDDQHHKINPSAVGSQMQFSGDARTDEHQVKRKKYIKYGIIGAVVTAIIVIIIVLSVVLTRGGNDDNGGLPIGYNIYTQASNIVNNQDSFAGTISTTQTFNEVEHKRAYGSLFSKDGGTDKLGVNTQGIKMGVNNQLIKNINFAVDMTDYTVARLIMTDADSTRYAVPKKVVNAPESNNNMRLDMVGFSYKLNPFSIAFKDSSDNSNVFLTTEGQTLLMSDKFIQMDFKLPSQRMYGFGERVREFQLTEGTWTMWADGGNSPYDDGSTGRKQVYGVHPFILVQGKQKGDFFGMYFRNSNAMSPVIKFNSDGSSILSYITIGGQIEVYFFIHGNAKTIIQMYQNVIGNPNLPPYWALGWQQASWKYQTKVDVVNTIQQYAKAGMNLETIYLDIPYMSNFSDFSINTTAFPDMVEFVNSLHANNQKIVPIIDGAISADILDNRYYYIGNLYNVFIKSGLYSSVTYNNNLIQKVWPDRAVFIDWLNDNCTQIINFGLDDLYAKLAFDGLWLDMNEATGFNQGEIKPEDGQPLNKDQKEEIKAEVIKRFLLEDNNNWYEQVGSLDQPSTYNLPFVPGFTEFGPLDSQGLSLNATHPGYGNEIEYNLHNLYGHMMAWRFNQYVTTTANSSFNKDNRPFLLTRSSFSSTGRFASHWLGDNWRSWDYMRYSVAGIMNMNMFGIPHVGADVCGFFGEKKDDEMCGRWVQLATFYPLARNHQNLTWKGNNSEFSEPYLLNEPYKTMARESITDRYRYLRHMYTCLFEANQYGGSCFDPLFYYYPNDDNLFTNIEESFIVGGALKVSPIYAPMANGTTTYTSYFPQGKWVSMIDQSIIDNSAGGKKVILETANVHTVQVHLREGALIAYQDITADKDKKVNTTTQLLTKPIRLTINPDQEGHAEGTLLLDGGISRAEISNGGYRYLKFSLNAKNIQNQNAQGNGPRTEQLDNIWIVNADMYKDSDFACLIDNNFKATPLSIIYNSARQTLVISNATADPILFENFRQISFGNSTNDLNLCNPSVYQYNVVGQIPSLNTNSVSIELSHAILPSIVVNITVHDINIVHVQWSWKLDVNGTLPVGKRNPFRVPLDIVNTTQKPAGKGQTLRRYISVTDKPFTINLLDNNQVTPGNILSVTGMIFDQFFNLVNFTANTPAADQFSGVFGLGMRANKDFFFKDGVYSQFNLDNLTPDEDGKPPSKGQYGTHPLFVFKHQVNQWGAVFMNQANAQDWWIKNDQVKGNVGLTSISTGSIVDMFLIQGKQPDNVISNYYSIVGLPTLQPNWALGWHNCRWGYKNLTMLDDVVKQYKSNNIPLDVEWSDIDYKKNYRSFTYDNQRYANFSEWLAELHANNQRWVPIIDIGISNRPKQDYPFVDDGYKNDVFLKLGGEAFIGRVWPGDTVYPDFFNPKTTPWWQSGLTSLHDTQNITFDGVWLDMNEFSNFCWGACYDYQKPKSQIKHKLPYVPLGRDMEQKTISMDIQHFTGDLVIDTHSLQSVQDVKATHEWFAMRNERSFIISRSSYAGLGKYGNVWLGDNFSTKEDMGYSVTGIMLSSMFGMQFGGGDICGFIGDTTPELCARWHVVGSYYPFSRNHNNYGQMSQEPYVFKGQMYEPGVDYMSIMRDAIYVKYSLNRYYYTQLTMISLYGGQQFYKPLFYAYPDDIQAYQNITYNVALGDSLKLSVNSDKLGQNQTWFYFPAGTWCNVLNPIADPCFNSTGMAVQKQTKAYDSYLHIIEGSIIPFQNAKDLGIMTTVDLQNQPIDLHIHHVSIGKNYRAEGGYLNDDGLSVVNLTVSKQNQYYFTSQISQNSLQVQVTQTLNATDYFGQMEANCSAVNMNDYLNALYFLNAKAIGLSTPKYQVNAQFVNGKHGYFGIAQYDTPSDRLIVIAESPLCISKISTIDFIPIQ